LFPKARFDLVIYLGYWKVKEIPTHTHAAVGTWLAEQTLLGFISQAFKISAIAFWAHVGGFAIGSLTALVFLSVVPESKRRDAVAGPTWDMREETTKQDDELTILKL
jgi:membrane associated rhomboid family serine protease